MSKKFSIFYTSDLHLEFGYMPMSELPDADMLIIAGDVAEIPRILEDHKKIQNSFLGFYDAEFTRCFSFFEEVAAKYEHIVYCIGNHEAYRWNLKTAVETLRRILPKKIKILDNEFLDFENFRIIGGTLWTDFDKANPIAMVHAQGGMNDFQYIEYGDKTFSPHHALGLHYTALGAFGKMIEDTDKDVILVSHHAPSMLSIPDRFKGSALNAAYASDLSEFILDNPRIKFWTHGHLHDPVDYMIGNCNVVSNPRGYYGYEKSQYSKERFIEI
jgi:predicted phosphohydrolase